jgi:nucleotidyltransferase substrate binding protein (TIGR01987 family)
MEHTGGYDDRLNFLKKALHAFESALRINDSDFQDIEQDTIKSGKIQKFEVCAELFWKTIKKYLYEIHGIEAISPKMVMKQLYQTKYVDEETYELLIEMINDRNRLSHIYNEALFDEIYTRIGNYSTLMKSIVGGLG